MDGALWSEARDALADVAELSRVKGGECLDIYCLNSPKYRLDIRVSRLSSSLSKAQTYLDQTEGEVHRFFNEIVPEGYHPRCLHIRYSCLHRPDTYRPQAQAGSGYLRSEG